jgi:ABC-type Co2+ transport system permease subunit
VNQLEAMRQTLALATTGSNKFLMSATGPFSVDHYQQMIYDVDRRRREFDEAKIGRYLGWMQAGVTRSLSYADPRMETALLERFKRINRSCV